MEEKKVSNELARGGVVGCRDLGTTCKHSVRNQELAVLLGIQQQWMEVAVTVITSLCPFPKSTFFFSIFLQDVKRQINRVRRTLGFMSIIHVSVESGHTLDETCKTAHSRCDPHSVCVSVPLSVYVCTCMCCTWVCLCIVFVCACSYQVNYLNCHQLLA